MAKQVSIFLQDQLAKYQLNAEALALLAGNTTERIDQIIAGDNPSNQELTQIAYALNLNLTELKNRLLLGATTAKAQTKAQTKPEAISETDATQAGLAGDSKFSRQFSACLLQHQLSDDAAAALLNISVAKIKQIKSGATPEPDLLKNICLLFDWNYQVSRRQTELPLRFTPPKEVITDFSGFANAKITAINELTQKIAGAASANPAAAIIDTVLSQLELIYLSLQAERDNKKSANPSSDESH